MLIWASNFDSVVPLGLYCFLGPRCKYPGVVGFLVISPGERRGLQWRLGVLRWPHVHLMVGDSCDKERGWGGLRRGGRHSGASVPAGPPLPFLLLMKLVRCWWCLCDCVGVAAVGIRFGGAVPPFRSCCWWRWSPAGVVGPIEAARTPKGAGVSISVLLQLPSLVGALGAAFFVGFVSPALRYARWR